MNEMVRVTMLDGSAFTVICAPGESLVDCMASLRRMFENVKDVRDYRVEPVAEEPPQ